MTALRHVHLAASKALEVFKKCTSHRDAYSNIIANREVEKGS